MPVDGEPNSTVPAQHARVARALISSSRTSEAPSPYVVKRLADHVAAAGVWDDLAAVPYLLDELNPDSVAVAVLRTAFGRADLPASVGASLSARHLFNQLAPEDRLMTRWIAVACGNSASTSDIHAWARIGEREPPHVAMFGHQGPVRAVVPWNRPDGGTLVLTSGDDGAVRFWDPMTGRPASEPLVDDGTPVLSMVTVTMDGRALLVAAGPGGVRVCSLENGDRIAHDTGGFSRRVRSLVALPQPDGKVLVAGMDLGGGVRLWDVGRDRLVPEPGVVSDRGTQALAAFPRRDGATQLVTVGYDGYLHFWDPETKRQIASHPLGRDAGPLTNAVTVDDSAAMLAVSRDDGSIELLEFDPAGRPGSDQALRVPGGAVVLATALIREREDFILAAAACADGNVHLFGRAADQTIVGSLLPGHRGRVLAAAFVVLGDTRTLLATGGQDGTVRLWYADPRGLAPARAEELARVQAIATVPTDVGDRLVVAGDNGSVQLHEVTSGAPLGQGFTGHRGAVHAVAAVRLPDGRGVLVTGGAERAVGVWDVATGGRLVAPLRGHQATIHAVAVLYRSPGEWLVASAGSDGAIRLWDPTSGRSFGSPLRGHRGPIRCLAVAHSPAGADTLVSGGDDGTVRLWQLNESGAVESQRVDLRSPVTAAAVASGTAADPVVAVGGRDGVLRLVDASTGRLGPALPTADQAEITSLTVVPTETTLLAAGYRDGAIRIWHSASERPLRTLLLPFGQWPRSLAATRSHLAVCTERGFLGVELDPRLARELTASPYRYRPALGTTLEA